MTGENKKILSTVPYDPRFPNTNQTYHCYQSFVDFQKCSKKRGEEFEACQYYKKAYKALCPSFWYQKWEGQVSEGTFAGKID